VAEQETGQEKTQDPTPKRIKDAREKGDIARSKELTTTVLLLSAALSLMVFGPAIATTMKGVMTRNLSLDRQDIFDPAMMFSHLGAAAGEALWAMLGFFGVVVFAALVSPMALGGWNFSGKAMAPKGSRLNPLSGIKRMFSAKALIELVKALAKFMVVGALCVVILLLQKPELLSMGTEDIVPAMAHGMEVLGWAFLLMCSTMILISAVDVPFQLYDYKKKLKMTMQEVKDEMKNTEGKPEVKGRIRQLQHEMAQRRMMSEVPQADVVITNPEHYSVALKYSNGDSGAPILVAKGIDLVALKIREVAVEHEIPMLAAPPLARAIYYNTELEQEIPEGLYVAVAQVLAYIYQLREYQARRAARPSEPKEFPIPDELQHD
jgi:flagellar biosynthetic protein FlhB